MCNICDEDNPGRVVCPACGGDNLRDDDENGHEYCCARCGDGDGMVPCPECATFETENDLRARVAQLEADRDRLAGQVERVRQRARALADTPYLPNGWTTREQSIKRANGRHILAALEGDHANPEDRDLYDRAVALWGEKAQLLMVVEECTELATAVLHKLRGRETDLVGEVADVQIMLEQLRSILGDHSGYEHKRRQKLERLRQRIEAAEAKSQRAFQLMNAGGSDV